MTTDLPGLFTSTSGALYLVEEATGGLVVVRPWSQRLNRQRVDERGWTGSLSPTWTRVADAPTWALVSRTLATRGETLGQIPMWSQADRLVTPRANEVAPPRDATVPEVIRWLRARGYTVRKARELPSNGSSTSKAAAASLRPVVGTLRRAVLDAVVAAGEEGVTCDELEAAMEGRHQTVSPRLYELRNQGFVVDSSRKRRTRSGRMAIVWVERKEERDGV